MNITFTVSESQADILIRALYNLTADSSLDAAHYAEKMAKSDAVYLAIDNYGDNSKAYEDARRLAFQASEDADRVRGQRQRLADMSQELNNLISEQWSAALSEGTFQEG